MLTFFLCWYLIGIIGFIWFWTEEFDFTVYTIILALIFGLSGPVLTIVVLLVYATFKKDGTVLVKRRK